jgi:hypothetical protein
MLDFILEMILVALSVAWLLNVFTISGFREQCIAKAPHVLLADLLSCDFCLSFWSSLLVCIFMCIFEHSWAYLFMPIFSAAIIKKLI